MPSVFKRPSQFRQAAVPAPPVQPAVNHPYLVSVNSLPKVRKPYGFKEAVTGPEGLVYGPTGVYSHITRPISQPTEHGEGGAVSFEEADVDLDSSQHANKKERQWRKWSEDIIPALLKPYLSLLQETSGLRNMNNARKRNLCEGCMQGRLLDVSCIFFESKLL